MYACVSQGECNQRGTVDCALQGWDLSDSVGLQDGGGEDTHISHSVRVSLSSTHTGQMDREESDRGKERDFGGGEVH